MLPFVRRFYGQPSSHIWEDEVGEVQDIPQGEGGDQDPLVPLLFSLVHPFLRSAADHLREGEKIFAFLDDVYLVCTPDRVLEVFRIIEIALWTHSKISVHCGKTQLWNRSGVTPTGSEELTRAAREEHPQAVVWRGVQSLPVEQQDVTVLGSPVGRVHQSEVDEEGDGTPHIVGTHSAGVRRAVCMAPVALLRCNQSKLLVAHSLARSDPSVRYSARPRRSGLPGSDLGGACVVIRV